MGFLPKPPAGENHDDLRGVARRLIDERSTLDDAGVQRVLRRVRPIGADRGLRRVRFAVTLSLVLGFCFSGAGAGLAISGIGDGATSSARQYAVPTEGSGTLGQPAAGQPATPTVAPPATTTEAPAGSGVAGQEESGGSDDDAGTGSAGGGQGGSAEESGDSGTSAVAPTTAAAADPVQAAQQLSTDSAGTLPFTGWAALPVVALGLLLLGAGLFLRRRTA